MLALRAAMVSGSVTCRLGSSAASAAVLRLAPGLLDVSFHLSSPPVPPARHPRQLESPGPSQRPHFTSGAGRGAKVWEPSHGSPHHNDDLGSWYRIRLDEQVDTPASRHDEGGVFESQHPSQRFAETLSTYRGTYPEDVWRKLCGMYPRRRTERPVAVDIAVGAEGRGGVELSRRGFHIIGVEADATLLARTWRLAQTRHASDMELITAKVEKSMLADGTADLVTFFHGLHLVNTEAALREAHRLLKPGGRLVAAWNDRDLSSPFVCQLEDLFEEFVPTYSRHDKQRSIEQWGSRLEDGGLFKLQDFSVHPNPVHLANAHSLLDIVDCFSFVRSTLRGAQRKEFNAEVRRLVEKRYGREPFDLPLETKLYVLSSLREDSLRDPPFRPVHGTLFKE